MISIRSQADLERANIQLAWAFTSKMTPEHFAELCRVTVVQLRRDMAEEWRDFSGRARAKERARIETVTEQTRKTG